MENAYNKAVSSLRNFTDNTNKEDNEDIKRTINYLEWNSFKT